MRAKLACMLSLLTPVILVLGPCTYGFGLGFDDNWEVGFGFGSGAVIWLGTWCHPWWGQFGWGWHHNFNYLHISLNPVDIYHHWQRNADSVWRPAPQAPATELQKHAFGRSIGAQWFDNYRLFGGGGARSAGGFIDGHFVGGGRQ
jgi:hypothetical protein